MCLLWFLSDYPVQFDHIDTCEVLEETVRGLEERLVFEETEKLASYERETQLISKVTKYNSHIYRVARKTRPELSHGVMQQSRWNESAEKHVCKANIFEYVYEVSPKTLPY